MGGGIATAIVLYVLLDGFDLGVGILFLFSPTETCRNKIMNSIAPFWDGNETWLPEEGGGGGCGGAGDGPAQKQAAPPPGAVSHGGGRTTLRLCTNVLLPTHASGRRAAQRLSTGCAQ